MTSDEPLAVSAEGLVGAIWRWFVGFECLLVVLDATVNYGEWAASDAIRRLFNITREDALANWFQSTQTLLVGGVLWLIAIQSKRTDGDARTRRGWIVLAVFFTYLAIDDGAKIHERVGTAIDEASIYDDVSADAEPFPRFPSYTWQLVFGPFFGAMGLFALLFVWRTVDATRLRALLIAGLGCFAGAVGLDYVEGLSDGYDWASERFSIDADAIAHFSKALEEFIEMLGTTCLLACFSTYFMRRSPVFSVRFTSDVKA
jgi:hypothetical protein